MKNFLLFIALTLTGYLNAQKVGIGTSVPATRLDVAGTDGWDVANGEGDMRIGNANYRLKFGVALGGGGAGASNIMQYGQPGGFNVLSLGAQGNQVLFVNGSLAAVGIGTASPVSKFQVNGTTTSTNLVLNGTGNGDANDFLIKSNASGLVGARKGHGASAVNFIIALDGDFPRFQGAHPNYDSTITGEIKMFAGSFAPAGWAFCHGQLLPIVNNQALFSILGTTYGGNGVNNFALPDLRGAVPVGEGIPAAGNSWFIGERTQ
ncbi:MAG: tail fiber protein [Bacteroidota bacterium]